MVLVYMLTWLGCIDGKCYHIWHTWILWDMNGWIYPQQTYGNFEGFDPRCRPPTAISTEPWTTSKSTEPWYTWANGWKKSTTKNDINGFHGNISEHRLKNQPITSRISLIWYIKKIFRYRVDINGSLPMVSKDRVHDATPESKDFTIFYPAIERDLWIIPMVIPWIIWSTSKNIPWNHSVLINPYVHTHDGSMVLGEIC